MAHIVIELLPQGAATWHHVGKFTCSDEELQELRRVLEGPSGASGVALGEELQSNFILLISQDRQRVFQDAPGQLLDSIHGVEVALQDLPEDVSFGRVGSKDSKAVPGASVFGLK